MAESDRPKRWNKTAAILLPITVLGGSVALVEINYPGSITNTLSHFSLFTVNVAPTDTLTTEDDARIDQVIRDQTELQQRHGFE